MHYLNDKTILVTGGANGIGYAVCQNFLKYNIKNLAIFDLCETKNLIENLHEIKENVKIIFEKVNVADKSELKRSFEKIKNEFGQIHVVVNCAGILNDKNIDLTFDVNVKGVINSSLFALDYMDIRNSGEGGYVINIASHSALQNGVWFFIPIYVASKQAILGFTQNMGNQYYANNCGVKFIAICPGGVRTNLSGNIVEKMLYPEQVNLLGAFKESDKFQTGENVAQCIVTAIESEKSGSVWLSFNEKNSEVKLVDFQFE